MLIANFETSKVWAADHIATFASAASWGVWGAKPPNERSEVVLRAGRASEAKDDRAKRGRPERSEPAGTQHGRAERRGVWGAEPPR